MRQHGRVAYLTERLRQVLDPDEVDLVSRRRHRDTRPVDDQQPHDLALVHVLVTLDAVPDGQDVIVYLG